MTTSPSSCGTRSTTFAKAHRALRGALLELLFPPRCAGCRRRGAWLCPTCTGQLRPLAPPWCARCGRPLRDRRFARCRGCRDGVAGALDWARAAYAFDGPLREAIHRFKYGGERARAAHLGPLLAPLLWAEQLIGETIVVPVPLDAARRRARGFNQAEELARALALTVADGYPLATGLVRVRETRPQVGLDRAARRENVRGAFGWQGPPLAGGRVLLVDDVMTSGATAEACAAALKAAGAAWVGLVTVARAVD